MSSIFSRLPRVVLVLGAVSLLNDIASEMIMPLLPVFLTTVLGAGPAALGLIEGVADATASLMKLGVGIVADRTGHRRRFVRTGYSVSNVARPVIAFASAWTAVLGLRFVDRVGKGIRTAPRDAMIAGSVSEARRGTAFGYHRAMDHAGASVGPILAFILLSAGWEIRDVILASVVPGILVVLLVFTGLGRAPSRAPASERKFRITDLPPEARRLILAAAGVTFATVPDALLIFWAFGTGLSVPTIPLLWAAAHVGRSLSTAWVGRLSDRFGRRRVTITGWAARVVMLVLLATLGATSVSVWPLFIVFTAVAACTEAVERAWISGLAPEQWRATFFGSYHMVVGLAVLPGSALLGIVWETWGASEAFVLSAALTGVFALLLGRLAYKLPR